MLYPVIVNDAVHELLSVEPATDSYAHLMHLAEALFEGERDFIANSANLSALLYHSLHNVNWCGFYLLRGDELVLGPFQGQIACVRIPLGRGVCGASALRRETIIVPDVELFPGHIACDPNSRSEIVIPLRANGQLLGVLDIDSPVKNRFEEQDGTGLGSLTELLLSASDLPVP